MIGEDMFDLKDKTAVVTGGGGVLCGSMALELASRGAGVAVLDLRGDAAQSVTDRIARAGGHAVAIACDVLDKAGLEAARDAVLAEFGGIDILINGAGGNSPKATTSHETCRIEDLQEDAQASTVVSGNPFPETSSNFVVSAFPFPKRPTSFFDLDPDAVEFVFRLNFIGTLLPSQVFGRVMAEQRQRSHPERILDERIQTAHEDPCVFRGESRHIQLHPVAGDSFRAGERAGERHRAGILSDRSEQIPSDR